MAAITTCFMRITGRAAALAALLAVGVSATAMAADELGTFGAWSVIAAGDDLPGQFGYAISTSASDAELTLACIRDTDGSPTVALSLHSARLHIVGDPRYRIDLIYRNEEGTMLHLAANFVSPQMVMMTKRGGGYMNIVGALKQERPVDLSLSPGKWLQFRGDGFPAAGEQLVRLCNKALSG